VKFNSSVLTQPIKHQDFITFNSSVVKKKWTDGIINQVSKFHCIDHLNFDKQNLSNRFVLTIPDQFH